MSSCSSCGSGNIKFYPPPTGSFPLGHYECLSCGLKVDKKD